MASVAPLDTIKSVFGAFFIKAIKSEVFKISVVSSQCLCLTLMMDTGI